MASSSERYSLRKRKQRDDRDSIDAGAFVKEAAKYSNLVVFSGSGLSASSGMSMFTTRNGLYDRARKRFKIQDGIKLFSYPFFKQRKLEVQAFFAEIYSEAQASKAAEGHHALADIWQAGCLRRHYTLNIDGLASVVGMDTWHHELNPGGSTVEMHGNIRQLVCPCCHATEVLDRVTLNLMKQQQPVPCKTCTYKGLRYKIMLYDDEEGDCITPDSVFDVLEEDLEVADAVLWVGISFEQSASVEYFRKVRNMLMNSGRLKHVKQVIINPNDEAVFNVRSSCSNTKDLDIVDVRATSEEVLPQLSRAMKRLSSSSNGKVSEVPLTTSA